MSQALTAPAIFLFTLYLVLARPRNLDSGLAALIGAVLALISGVITLADVTTVAGIVWDATFALIAIVIISVILDQAGFFRWAALLMARRAGGEGRAIFTAAILMGAFTSTLFTNDATVLILTPILYEMLRALGFDHRTMLPYLMASGFVADAMSIPLAVSNLTNMIAVRYFAFPFGRFALLMLIPSAVTLLATWLVLRWYYRREIPAMYDQSALPPPSSAIRDPFLFKTGLAVLTAMVLAFFLNSAVGSLPVSLVITTGAAILLAASSKNRVVRPVAVLKAAPWHVMLFALGMYLVVYGMGNAGLTGWAAGLLAQLASLGTGWAVAGTGLLVALFSSLMNNLPGVMLGVLAIGAGGATGVMHDGMVLAAVVGAGVGAKLTPIGSLATLIWMHTLQQKGIRITWSDYLKAGLVITPPVLLAALAALWLSLWFFG
ncbi:MAG: arsenical efflux pump membrane protein ArsB [Bacillota bacterium]